MPDTKHFAIGDLFPQHVIDAAIEIGKKNLPTPHAELVALLTDEVMQHVNQVTGQENNRDYMAYMLEHALNQARH